MNSCTERCDRNLLQTDPQGLNSIHPLSLFLWSGGTNILSTILLYLWILLPAQRGGIQFSWQSFGQTPEAVLQVVSFSHFPQLLSQRSPQKPGTQSKQWRYKIEIYSVLFGYEKGNIFWRKKINRIFLYHACVFL